MLPAISGSSRTARFNAGRSQHAASASSGAGAVGVGAVAALKAAAAGSTTARDCHAREGAGEAADDL